MKIEMCKIYHILAYSLKIMSKQGKTDKPWSTEVNGD